MTVLPFRNVSRFIDTLINVYSKWVLAFLTIYTCHLGTKFGGSVPKHSICCLVNMTEQHGAQVEFKNGSNYHKNVIWADDNSPRIREKIPLVVSTN